jgi:hypothetical protein
MFTRRAFGQLSAGAALATAFSRLEAMGAEVPVPVSEGGAIRVHTTGYTWEYTQATDSFVLHDANDRLIVSGTLQPAITVSPANEPAQRRCSPGKGLLPRIEPGRITFAWEQVNSDGETRFSWRFEQNRIWMEPIEYESTAGEDVVSLRYFCHADGGDSRPSLHSTYLVIPGISEGSGVSPILRDSVHLDQNVWLGRGSSTPGLLQQWGLPVHYFCGFSLASASGAKNMFTSGRSDAFALGLADLPAGDVFLDLHEGNAAPHIDYRSDLWRHLRTPGKLTLGATFVWATGQDYRQAIASYYDGLVQAGLVRVRTMSPHKTEVALTPQFCTWGSQLDEDKAQDHLDQAYLEQTYEALKRSGMKAGLFSIDDKWEGAYGNLEHSATRLPRFESFLQQLRNDGFKVGIWAALMRCEHPADIGLTEQNMLQTPEGKPYQVGNSGGTHYFILDFTQPAVEKVLDALVRRFVRRYKPDLFKFDFGYELPALSVAAPQDKHYTGERLMARGLDIVLKAMREENPDLVVMYYQLSPLFLDSFDLHSTDDLFMAAGEYEFEANRRMYFSSLLGPLGVPTYGSSGYDWESAPAIWFDSAAVGTIGSLNDFLADERGERDTAAMVAQYNGIAHTLRQTTHFRVVPFGGNADAFTFGAHAHSWARLEQDEVVLVAVRPVTMGTETPTARQPHDAVFGDLVKAPMPVVVASRGASHLSRDPQLAVVPYGEGEISIRRNAGSHALILHHYFGGGITRREATIKGGLLTFSANQANADGKPLEWIEVHIS